MGLCRDPTMAFDLNFCALDGAKRIILQCTEIPNSVELINRLGRILISVTNRLSVSGICNPHPLTHILLVLLPCLS
jgi:hypothetical protein